MMRPEERESHAWCPTCRRSQPCVRNLGTTDWQALPVYTCRSCGRVIHEPVLRRRASLARDLPVLAEKPSPGLFRSLTHRDHQQIPPDGRLGLARRGVGSTAPRRGRHSR